MTTATTEPTPKTLADVRLEDISLPAPFMGALDDLEISDMEQVHGVTTGGNEWDLLENKLHEVSPDMPMDTLKLGMADLKTKYGLAIEQIPSQDDTAGKGGKSKSNRSRSSKPADPQYMPTYGKGEYDYSFPVRISGKPSLLDKGKESRESESSTSVSISLKGDGQPGIDKIKALDLFHNVKLDVMIHADDEDQQKLEGMDDEREPCYGIVEIAGPHFGKEHITLTIKLKGHKDRIYLSQWGKSKARLSFNVIEKDGIATKRAKVKKAEDPDQGKLSDAA